MFYNSKLLKYYLLDFSNGFYSSYNSQNHVKFCLISDFQPKTNFKLQISKCKLLLIIILFLISCFPPLSYLTCFYNSYSPHTISPKSYFSEITK